MDFNSWNIFWSLCFGSVATVIAVGNTLAIWILFKLRHRKRAYILLISLAVADLLVGVLAIPLYMTTQYIFKTASASEWSVWYLILTGVDAFTGIASIYTLAFISLERMVAIGWPFRHRALNFRVYIVAVITPWIVGAIFTVTVLLQPLDIIEHDTFLYLLVLFPGTPLLIMSIAYFVVWKKQKSPFGEQNHAKREAKLAKTLIFITVASLLTWLPFQILNLHINLSAIKDFPSLPLTLFIVKLLQFMNSLVNVIIYPFRLPEFKDVLLQIFRCCVVSFPRFNAEVHVSSQAGSGSVVSLIRFTKVPVLPANYNQETSL